MEPMALLGKFDSSYTRTGNGGLTSFANKMSFVPFIGPWIAGILSAAGTVIESIGWLIKGKPISALTVAASGSVSTALNAVNGVTWGALNIGSGITTGRSIGTHGRKLTESVIGGVTGMLGVKPEVLRSFPAGIGSIGGGAAQAGPGRFASQIASERDRNPNEMYAAYQRGEGGAHINELQSANMGRA
jgi:hypothetical protein